MRRLEYRLVKRGRVHGRAVIIFDALAGGTGVLVREVEEVVAVFLVLVLTEETLCAEVVVLVLVEVVVVEASVRDLALQRH